MKYRIANQLVYLFTFFILLQGLSSAFVFSDYLLNKSFIIENLCVNKATPELKCNGKCYLMRQLAEQEHQKENSSRESAKKLFEQVLFFKSHSVLNNVELAFSLPVSLNNWNYQCFSSVKATIGIFHPPQAA